MKDYIAERARMLAHYIIENEATVRETAKEFSLSKSSVHKDVTARLEKISPHLAFEVKKVLEHNKEERHIRGGLATKKKYEMLKAEDRI
ncbi:MAG: sporulation transcriptional regulator SpoIIID [Clostridia bacterium]|nr:sporulation transcriptional regulator SpoIIID [Clostridia bacterium]